MVSFEDSRRSMGEALSAYLQAERHLVEIIDRQANDDLPQQTDNQGTGIECIQGVVLGCKHQRLLGGTCVWKGALSVPDSQAWLGLIAFGEVALNMLSSVDDEDDLEVWGFYTEAIQPITSVVFTLSQPGGLIVNGYRVIS